MRVDKSTSTGTASKLVSVSGVPAREDAAPSNLDYRSKLAVGSRIITWIFFEKGGFLSVPIFEYLEGRFVV